LIAAQAHRHSPSCRDGRGGNPETEADMTIKWVKVDPLVMRGEPFCYNTRLTVRQLLELRRAGYGVAQLLHEHPELRVVGIAQAYLYAAEHRDLYREFFGRDGALTGPGFSDDEASVLPDELRIPGIVVARAKAAARARS
jgi:uncharacterized protein (DUF433 family)